MNYGNEYEVAIHIPHNQTAYCKYVWALEPAFAQFMVEDQFFRIPYEQRVVQVRPTGRQMP